MYTVYLHRNVYNGKVYICITSTKPSRRWKGGHGYESQSRFWNAIKKYGWKSFEHEILFERLTKKEAEEKEVELIKQYKSNQREYGYNLSEGGGVNRGYRLSEETRRKLSKSKSNFIPWNKGLKGYKVPSAQGKKEVKKQNRK